MTTFLERHLVAAWTPQPRPARTGLSTLDALVLARLRAQPGRTCAQLAGVDLVPIAVHLRLCSLERRGLAACSANRTSLTSPTFHWWPL